MSPSPHKQPAALIIPRVNEMTTIKHTPFLTARLPIADDEDTALESDQEPVHEDVSDGLQIFRKSSGWFTLTPSYTRKDCRCGQCSIGDPEPCTYARPTNSTAIGSVLSVGRSLTRLLSSKESLKDT